MTISELIAQLEIARAEHGDIEVIAPNETTLEVEIKFWPAGSWRHDEDVITL